jgi:ankyrin repeat protein
MSIVRAIRFVALVGIAWAASPSLALAEDAPSEIPPHAYLFYEAASKGDFDTARDLLADHPDLVKQKYDQGITALHAAALSNEPRIAELLLEHGALVDVRAGRQQLTPLYVAVTRGNEKTAKVLLARHADPNAKAEDGALTNVTPLHMAALNARADLADLLITNGAKLDVKTSGGETATDYAVRKGATMVRQVIAAYRMMGLTKGRPVAELIRAIDAQDSAWTAKVLDTSPALANVKLDDDVTPLHLAAGIGSRPLCELLLARHADPAAREKGTHYAPFERALNAGYQDLAEMLRVQEAAANNRKR